MGMIRGARFFLLILLITVVISACNLLPVSSTGSRFGIIDYRPSVFIEQPTAPFFFSIGDELRFDRAISETSPVLFKGELTAVYPSPDEKKAAIVSDGRLYLAEPGQPPRLLLTAVDNFAAVGRSFGEIFYQYPSLQWDAHSRSLFIIRATKDNGPSQAFPRGATLVSIDPAEPGRVTDVVPDFRSMRYFFVGDDAFCFDYAQQNGDVTWKCARNGVVMTPKSLEDNRIVLADGTSILGKPFLSYHPDIYESEIWLTFYGFSIQPTQGKKFGFFSKYSPETPIFLVKTGYNIKGHFGDAVMQNGCIVLPGGRYALLNIASGASTAQVLVDGVSGLYRGLPRETRVYRNLNTSNYGNVRVGFGGTDSIKFAPVGRLRSFASGVSR